MANRSPGVYKLIELSIVNFQGKRIDVSASFDKFDIQIDLFNSCMHGSVMIKDKGDFQQNIPLIGEELLYVKFRVDEHAPIYSLYFYIYQLNDKEKTGEDGFNYTLSFCSIELLNNRNTSISESFYDLSISTAIKNIFQKISKKRLTIENTSNKIRYIAPSISPFEIINYMSARSVSSKYPNSGSYVFYEDLLGFNYKTVDSMFDGKIKAEYYFNHKSYINNNFDYQYYTIDKWRVEQHYNILDNLNKGMYGSTTHSLNPFTREYKPNVYNYFNNSDYMKTNHIETTNPQNSLQTSKFMFKDASDNFIKFRLIDDFQSNKEKKIGVRYSQLNQITNAYKLVLQVPGNTDLFVGDLINLNYLNYSIDNDKIQFDRYLKGKYLITSVRHMFTQKEMKTVIEIIKDSYYSNHESNDRIGMISTQG